MKPRSRSRWLAFGALAALAFGLAAAGCKCGGEKKHHQPPGADLPPLAAPASGPSTTLPVQGFMEAVVDVPVGATRPMPVLVAVLGIGDTPEEQCAAWRDIVADNAFVLCPRGAKNMVTDDEDGGVISANGNTNPNPSNAATPSTNANANANAGAPSPTSKSADLDSPPSSDPSEPDPTPSPSKPESADNDEKPIPPPTPKSASKARQVGFYPVDLSTLDREVTAGLAALKAKFGAHVSDAEPVYAGFSRGAFLGASLAAKRPNLFRRVILIEGGQSAWQTESASAFAKGGGRRVLFVCGQPQCVEESEPAATTLRTQKIEARVVHGAGEGHGYKKQVKEELRKSFEWVTEGDPRWP